MSWPIRATGSPPAALAPDAGRFPVLAELVDEYRLQGGCAFDPWQRAAREKLALHARKRRSRRRQTEVARILAAFSAAAELIAFLAAPTAEHEAHERFALRSQCISTQAPERSRRLTILPSHATPAGPRR